MRVTMNGAAQAVAILLLVCALTAAEESDGTVAVCGNCPAIAHFFSLCLTVSASGGGIVRLSAF